jgi:stage III sporulation protein AE
MYKLRILFYACLLVLLISEWSYAGSYEENENQEVLNFFKDQAKDLDKDLSEGESSHFMKSILPDFGIRKILGDVLGGKNPIPFKDIQNSIQRIFMQEMSLVVKLGFKLLAALLIMSLFGVLKTSFSHTKVQEIAFFSGYIVIAVMLYDLVQIGVDMTKEVILNCIHFFYATFPLLMVLYAKSGGWVSYSFVKPITLGAFGILFAILQNVILPLILFQVALAFVSNFSDKIHLKELGNFIKQGTLWLMGIFLTLFVGILSLQGNLGYGIDNMTAKTAKFAISSSIPFAGKYLSDASDTILGYSMLMKNSAGLFAMLSVVGIAMIPILKMMVWCLFFKVLSIVAGVLPDRRFVSLLEDCGGVFFLLLSIIIVVVLMFYFSIAFVMGSVRFL